MRREAWLLVAMAGFSTLGCAELNAIIAVGQIAGAVVETTAAAGLHDREARLRGNERVEVNEETRLTALRDQSRSRLYPPGGPACAVRILRTGARTWQLESCGNELHCWALSEGYDCEPVSSNDAQPL